MNLEIESAVFIKDPRGWDEFTRSPEGVVGSDLRKRGRRLKHLAQETVPKRTGHLAKSLYVHYYRGLVNPYVTVGSPLNYAYYVHEGTRPHTILPKHGKMLRFKLFGKIVYAEVIHHPGTKPTKFLSRHLGSVVK